MPARPPTARDVADTNLHTPAVTVIRLLPVLLLSALLLPIAPVRAADDTPESDDDAASEGIGPFDLPPPRPGPEHIERGGAGMSMGIGGVSYDPAPTSGPRINLPSLEVALVPPGMQGQVRVRSPLLNTLAHAALRRVMHLEIDAIVLATDCKCAVGNHAIRPLVGPSVGMRIAASRHHTLGGVGLGARLGFEYLAPLRRFGFFVALEPVLEVWSGRAGAESTTLLGAGAVVQFGVTRYRPQNPGGVK